MIEQIHIILPDGEAEADFRSRMGREAGALNDALLAGCEKADGSIQTILIPVDVSLGQIRKSIDVASRPISDPDADPLSAR